MGVDTAEEASVEEDTGEAASVGEDTVEEGMVEATVGATAAAPFLAGISVALEASGTEDLGEPVDMVEVSRS